MLPTQLPEEPIGQQGLLSQMRRALGLQRPTPDLLDSRIALSVQSADMERPENLWLKRGYLLQGGENLQPGGAGTFATAQLSVPGTGRMVVVERILVSATGAGTLLVGLAGLQALTLRTLETRDSRSNRSGSAIVLSSGTPGLAVAPFFGPLALLTVAGTQYTVEGPWVVAPGSLLAFTLSMQTANIGLAYGITWWERDVLPQEL